MAKTPEFSGNIGVSYDRTLAGGTLRLGGNYFYTNTVELKFPLGLPEELDVRGRVFTDVAAVWDVEDLGLPVAIDDSSSPRVTVGAGFSWNSPFGPLVIDLGFAVIKEDFDETELLSFSFGTQF